jgi:hypothetical protein
MERNEWVGGGGGVQVRYKGGRHHGIKYKVNNWGVREGTNVMI